jgi:hypothetical protein
MVAPSPISAWPAIPAWPPTVTPRPSRLLPEIPTCAAMMLPAPIRTLWPIWTRLSIFVWSPISVVPMEPRSIVTFAPISTSAPITQWPTCGIFRGTPPTAAYPKPSTPMRVPEWITVRSPTRVSG